MDDVIIGHQHDRALDGINPAQLTSAIQEEAAYYLNKLHEHGAAALGAACPSQAPPIEQAHYLAHVILGWAIEARATEIHVEPTRTSFRLRLRVDGALGNGRLLDAAVGIVLGNALRRLAGSVTPLDERMPTAAQFSVDEFQFTLRELPGRYGRPLVVGMPPCCGTPPIKIGRLGGSPSDVALMCDWMRRPDGLILVHGHTDSCKTTIARAFLTEIDLKRPVALAQRWRDWDFPHASRITVDRRLPLDADAIPYGVEVVCVDSYTSYDDFAVLTEMAKRLLVIATIGTDQLGTIVSLVGGKLGALDVFANVFIGAVRGMVVPRMCPDCRTPDKPLDYAWRERLVQLAVQERVDLPVEIINWRGKGCRTCHGYGHRDRLGMIEVVENRGELSTAIRLRQSAAEIDRVARTIASRTIRRTAIEHALAANIRLASALYQT